MTMTSSSVSAASISSRATPTIIAGPGSGSAWSPSPASSASRSQPSTCSPTTSMSSFASAPMWFALWSDQEVARRWLALFPGRVRSQTASAVAAPGRLSRASGQVRRGVGACCVRYAEVTRPSEAPLRAYSGFLFQCYSSPSSEDARFIDEQLGLLVRASYQGQGVPVRD